MLYDHLFFVIRNTVLLPFARVFRCSGVQVAYELVVDLVGVVTICRYRLFICRDGNKNSLEGWELFLGKTIGDRLELVVAVLVVLFDGIVEQA